MEYVSPRTGVRVLDEYQIADYRREIYAKYKEMSEELKEIDKVLAESLAAAYDSGEKKFYGWQLGAMKKFNRAEFEEEATKTEVEAYDKAKELIKTVESSYKTLEGKPFLKVPKFF